MSTFGPEFLEKPDGKRVRTQHSTIRDVMLSASEIGAWHTLAEIERLTNSPQASISAQLRHLRKAAFGGFIVEKRHRGPAENGLYEYQVHPAPPRVAMQLELLKTA